MRAPRRRRPWVWVITLSPFEPWNVRAVRSLPAAALLELAERVVEERQTLERGVLVDRQRRLEPHVRRVGHGEEPALHAALVDLLHDRAVERLLRRAVLHHLDADEQAGPSHVADEGAPLLHAAQLRHHLGTD